MNLSPIENAIATIASKNQEMEETITNLGLDVRVPHMILLSYFESLTLCRWNLQAANGEQPEMRPLSMMLTGKSPSSSLLLSS